MKITVYILFFFCLVSFTADAQHYRVKEGTTALLYKSKEDARLGINPLMPVNQDDVITMVSNHATQSRLNEVEIDGVKGVMFIRILEPIVCSEEWENAKTSKKISQLETLIKTCSSDRRLVALANQRIKMIKAEELTFYNTYINVEAPKTQDIAYYTSNYANFNQERYELAVSKLKELSKNNDTITPNEIRTANYIQIINKRNTERFVLIGLVAFLLTAILGLLFITKRQANVITSLKKELNVVTKKYQSVLAMLKKFKNRDNAIVSTDKLYAAMPEQGNHFNLKNDILKDNNNATFLIELTTVKGEAVLDFADESIILQTYTDNPARFEDFCTIQQKVENPSNAEIISKGRLKKIGKTWTVLQKPIIAFS